MTDQHSIDPVDENLEPVDEPVVISGTEIGNGGLASRQPGGATTSSDPVSDIFIGRENTFGSVIYALDEEELVVVYRDDASKEETGGHGGDGKLVQVRSRDGGETWGKRRTIFDTPGVSDRDPRGGMTPDGTLVCFFARTNIEADTVKDAGWIRSTNGGQTWSEYTTIDDRGWGRHVPYGNISAVERSDGHELFFPVWASTDYDSPEGVLNDGEVWVISSTDDGKSWQYKGTIVDSPEGGDIRNETDVVALPDGNLLAMVRRLDTTGYEQYHSTDGGATWSYDGLASVGITGEECAPIMSLEDGTVKFFSTHRAPYHTNRSAQYMSYATADASEVVGSPDAWTDHVWWVQDTWLRGYPHVAEAGDRTFVTFTWNDADGHENLGMVTERDVQELVAARQHVHYDAVQDARGVSGNVPVYFDEQEVLVYTDDPTNEEWHTVDISDKVPAGAERAIFTQSVRADGTSSTHPSWIALRNPIQGGKNFEAYTTVPGDSGSIAGETASCSLDGGRFQWKSSRANLVVISLAGFV